MRRRAGPSAGVGARRLGGAPLAIAIAIAATGCASAPPPATAVPVRLEIVQLRGDVTEGFVELRVTNEGPAALVVERATYVSSAWTVPMQRDDEARIPAGARRNLRMQLPEPTCAGGRLEHRATLELADGSIVEGEPDDPLGQLEALDDAICELRAFEREVAAIAWREPSIPADGAGPAVLRLEVTPVAGDGGRAGSIDEVAATVLLVPVDAAGERIEVLPVGAEIDAGAAPTVVEVPVAPGRCDLHAIAEDKQGTLFRIRATHGDDPVTLVLPSPDEQRNALLDFVVASCGSP